jgi:hypothetical protein
MICKLVELDIHGLLRPQDIQNLIDNNKDLRVCKVKNFEWTGPGVIDVSKLRWLEWLQVFADNDLQVMVSENNHSLHKLELAAWIHVTPMLVNSVVNLTSLRHASMHFKQPELAKLFLQLCKAQSCELAFTETAL